MGCLRRVRIGDKVPEESRCLRALARGTLRTISVPRSIRIPSLFRRGFPSLRLASVIMPRHKRDGQSFLVHIPILFPFPHSLLPVSRIDRFPCDALADACFLVLFHFSGCLVAPLDHSLAQFPPTTLCFTRLSFIYTSVHRNTAAFKVIKHNAFLCFTHRPRCPAFRGCCPVETTRRRDEPLGPPYVAIFFIFLPLRLCSGFLFFIILIASNPS